MIVYLKSGNMLSTNRYVLGLSNEILFIIIAQGAAKLWRVKVGGPKKIGPSTLTGYSFVATWLMMTNGS